MTLDAIKESIENLREHERLALESWLAEVWESVIERDFSPGGAGMVLLREVDGQIEAGNVDRFKVTRPSGRVEIGPVCFVLEALRGAPGRRSETGR